MVVIALVAYLSLSLISHYITFSSGSNTIVSIGRDMAQNIGRDLARRFGIVAAGCLIVGIITRILAGRLQLNVMRAKAKNSTQAS